MAALLFILLILLVLSLCSICEWPASKSKIKSRSKSGKAAVYRFWYLSW